MIIRDDAVVESFLCWWRRGGGQHISAMGKRDENKKCKMGVWGPPQ